MHARVWILAVGWTLAFARPALAAPGVSARLQEALSGIPAGAVPTGVLADRMLEMAALAPFDGSAEAPAATLREWRQLYHEIRGGFLAPPAWPDANDLVAGARLEAERGIIPLGVLDVRYDRIRPEALADGSLFVVAGRLTLREPDGGRDAFSPHRLVAAAPLVPGTHRGESVRFRLGGSLLFSNEPGAPVAVSADFGDGEGWRDVALDGGAEVAIRYRSTGRKAIVLRWTRGDGSTASATSVFDVHALRTPEPSFTLPITASIAYQGVHGTGEAYVYLAPGHDQITEAAVVIEGFDFDNTMGWDELYALLNRENLLENLRAAGFDAVVLNFTNAVDYIQRNGFVALELIQQVQATIGPDRSLVVAGASMGGLVGRYALSYMETMGIPHQVRTFLSFDSPQDGANIPLGIQYWLAFFAENSPEAAAFLAALDSPGARQMLAYHHTDPPHGIGESDPLRDALVAELAALGDYPDQPRTVAIANGSAQGWAQGYPAGAQLIQWEYSSFLVDVIGNVWAVPDATSGRIFHGLIDIIFLPEEEQTVSVTGTLPYDNAPGGWRDSMADMDAVDAPYGDIIALQSNHCFIPSVSALAVDTGDLFDRIADDPDILDRTPFDAVYFPSSPQNQEHVEINGENALWLFEEITQGANDVAAGAHAGPGAPGVASVSPNPARARARIEIDVPVSGPARLALIDASGRIVGTLLDADVSAGRHRIEVPLLDRTGRAIAGGAYFLELRSRGFRASGRLQVR